MKPPSESSDSSNNITWLDDFRKKAQASDLVKASISHRVLFDGEYISFLNSSLKKSKGLIQAIFNQAKLAGEDVLLHDFGQSIFNQQSTKISCLEDIERYINKIKSQPQLDIVEGLKQLNIWQKQTTEEKTSITFTYIFTQGESTKPLDKLVKLENTVVINLQPNQNNQKNAQRIAQQLNAQYLSF